MAISDNEKMMLNKETPIFERLRFGTLFQLVQTTLATAVANIATNVTNIGKKVSIGIAAGTNATTVDTTALGTITSIVAILAITTTSGAAATKLLLAATTDYTLTAGVLATVGDKSAVTLLVIYK